MVNCTIQELEEKEELMTQSEILKKMTKSFLDTNNKSYINEIKETSRSNIIDDYISYTTSIDLTFEESEAIRKFSMFLIDKV